MNIYMKWEGKAPISGVAVVPVCLRALPLSLHQHTHLDTRTHARTHTHTPTHTHTYTHTHPFSGVITAAVVPDCLSSNSKHWFTTSYLEEGAGKRCSECGLSCPRPSTNTPPVNPPTRPFFWRPSLQLCLSELCPRPSTNTPTN